MPKAEVGSTKHLSNRMKSKGLQRLRWYCQVCERQMRDENGFKMHTQSESHVRQMQLVGEDPKKFINEYSKEFQRDFINLLKTGHGEKQVHMNRFYQEYIANKEHIHMNSTKWSSLTEFAKHLGREGLCRVEENDKGLHISWIDDSPDALRRKEAVRRKELQNKDDEEREQRMIQAQIKRAHKDGAIKEPEDDADDAVDRELRRDETEKIKLSFGTKPAPEAEKDEPLGTRSEFKDSVDTLSTEETTPAPASTAEKEDIAADSAPSAAKPAIAPMSLKTSKPQAKNVFAAAKKNALAGGPKKPSALQPPPKMSEAERIMREEMERNKKRSGGGGFSFGMSNKKQRTN